jgi:hypothetical protein
MRKGSRLSDEHRRKIGLSQRGRHLSEATRRKISISETGKIISPETRIKLSVSRKGKPLSAAHRKAISRAQIGKKRPHVGVPHSVESIEKIRKAMKGKKNPHVGVPCSVTKRKKIGDAQRRVWANPEYHKKMSEDGKHRCASSEVRAKMSEVGKQLWVDPDFACMMLKAQHIAPNRAERLLYSVLQETLPGEYVINTKAETMVIGGKIPDFVSVNGHKKLIELYGDYWHKGHISKDRIDYFKKFGYDTLVVWEHELKDIEAVRTKLLAFNQR